MCVEVVFFFRSERVTVRFALASKLLFVIPSMYDSYGVEVFQVVLSGPQETIIAMLRYLGKIGSNQTFAASFPEVLLQIEVNIRKFRRQPYPSAVKLAYNISGFSQFVFDHRSMRKPPPDF